MSIFFGGKKEEVVLMSPFSGQLLFEGKPAANAKVKLLLKWKDKVGEQFEYQADANGMFEIPLHKVVTKINPLAQLVVRQEINVEYGNGTFLIWKVGKMNFDLYSEFGGPPQHLQCELTTDLQTFSRNSMFCGTSCSWDAIDS